MNQYIVNLYYRYKKGWGFFGDYETWQAAATDCEGYDAAPILDRVLSAARAVKNDEAVFERDGFLFYKKHEIANLTQWLRTAQNTAHTEGGIKGALSVLDFGGSLASLYFQHRETLAQYTKVNWCVVEQAHFVDIGKEEFETDELKFEYSIADAVQKYHPNIALISGVLQYLENPYTWLDEIVKHKIPYFCIDLKSFSDR